MNDKQIEQWAKNAKYFYGEDGVLLEMARVGYFFRDKFEVYIHTDDPGNEPHFHIRDASTRGQDFHTCIKILSPEYFHHTGKEDVLNSHEKKALVEFLKEKPTNSKKTAFVSNWDKLVYEWNENNSNVYVDEDMEMPNYMDLNA